MDFLKAKLPLTAAIAALSIAMGAGGTWAAAAQKQVELTTKVDAHEARIQLLEQHLVRFETLLEDVGKTVDRIERKQDEK